MSLLTLLSRRRGGAYPVTILLDDDFITPVAAPLAASRNAEPGPGTLVKSLDNTDKASIASGKLSFAGGTGAFSDPRYFLGSVAKRLGLMQVWRGYRPANSASIQFGLAHINTPDTTGSITGFYVPASTQIRLYRQASTIPSIAIVAMALNTSYDLAVLERAWGDHYFWRLAGGTWTLLWSHAILELASGFTGPLRGAQIDNANATVTIDGHEVVAASWLPTPLACDSFDRAGATLGLTDGGANTDATTGGDGLAWVAQSGTWATSGGQAVCSALSGGVGIATVETGMANALLDCVPSRAGGVVGLVIGYVDASNYIVAYHDGTNVKLDKVVAGVTTPVATAAIAYVAGARLMARRVGNNIYVAYNNTGVALQGSTVADAALVSATKHGLYTTNVGNGISDLLCWRTEYGTGLWPRDSPARAISVMAPAPYQVHQRAWATTNTATIPVAGTYNGGGTVDIEARFNGGSWATIASGVTGAFLGSLTAQAVGSGNLDVRVVGTQTAVAVHHVGVGDVFVIAGQSNASGRGVTNQVWASAAGLAAGLFTNANVWRKLTDPTDDATGQVDAVSNDPLVSGAGTPSASYWPLLATLYMARTGVPCAFVPCALGSTTIAQWQPSGSGHQDRATLYGSMVYRALLATGGVAPRAVLWHQGESDATVNAGLTSNAYYTGQTQALGDAVLADLVCPLVDARIHLWIGVPTTDATHLGYVNNAKAAVYGTHNVLAGPDLSSPNWVTTLHGGSDAVLLDAATRWDAALDAAGID
jgi:hypothetical protein